jgi:hypothetical protein
MADWTNEDHLRFAIAFALKKLRVRGVKPMDEQQRNLAAQQIIEHLSAGGSS